MTQPTLPSNVDAERATLGSVLLNRDALAAIAAWLKPEYFYLERHNQIYEAMLACFNNRVPPIPAPSLKSSGGAVTSNKWVV